MERTGRSSHATNTLLILAYLSAATTANLAVGTYGAAAVPFTAFFLVPFDLCARDILHERWSGRGLGVRMAALVGTGSLLSYLAAPDAAPVALASALAFAAAGLVDSSVYWLGRGSSRAARMNVSNVFASITDSAIFPVVAFGSTTLALSASQAGTKIIGGLFWSWIFLSALRAVRRRNGEGCTASDAIGLRCGEEVARGAVPGSRLCAKHEAEAWDRAHIFGRG